MVPQILVGVEEGTMSGSLFTAWLSQMLTPNGRKAQEKE
jgi:hypothetical protein